MSHFHNLLLFCSFSLLTIVQCSQCPDTPTIVRTYVSHYVQDDVNPFYFITVYWTHTKDWCGGTSKSYYELVTCDKSDCSASNSTSVVERKKQSAVVFANEQDTWLYLKVRAVSSEGNTSDWSKVAPVDVSKLNPEPWLLFTTYIVGQVGSTEFEHNPYGYYIQPETRWLKKMPSRIARKPWPALFDYECCSSQGVTVVPAEPEALYFNLTQDIIDLKKEKSIHGKLGVSFDWVSSRHFAILRCYGPDYCIFNVDDSDPKKRKLKDRNEQIYQTSERIYQVLYNPTSSLLFWLESSHNSQMFQIKLKFKDEKELSLSEKCPCASNFAFSSPAITFDWRSYFAENGTEPGLVAAANNTLWRLDSVLTDCTCEPLISNLTEVTGDSKIVQTAVDWSTFYWLNASGELYSYIWESGAVASLWRSRHIKQKGYITQMRAFGAEIRPLAPEECFFPTIRNVSFDMVSTTDAVVTIDLQFNNTGRCQNFPKPPVDVTLEYIMVDGSQHDPINFTCSKEMKCQLEKVTWSRKHKIQFQLNNLKFNKTYFLQTSVFPTNPYPEKYFPYKDRVAETYRQFNISLFQPEVRIPTGAIIGSVCVIVALLIILGIVMAMYLRKWHKFIDIPRFWPHQLKRERKWDPVKKREVDARLGGGEFGDVYLEKFKGTKLSAVKYLKDKASDYDERCFLDEIRIMWMAKGPFIVELQGICLTSRPYRFMMEYIEGNSLLKHLEHLREDKYKIPGTLLDSDDEKDLLKAMADASKACVHLDEIGILHRDIAARNFLIEYTKNTGKINQVRLADFGLAKEVGTVHQTYTTPQGRVRGLPFRLLAIEALKNSEFSPKTEVWEVGVLIWETFSLGDVPYNFLEPFREKDDPFQVVLDYLNTGKRLPRPVLCQHDRHFGLYDLMNQCWAAKPEDRPAIQIINRKIEEISRQLKRPVQAVQPLPSRAVSEVGVERVKAGPLSVSTSAQSRKSVPGTPQVAYQDHIFHPAPTAVVNIEMQEQPLVATGYKYAARRPRKLTSAAYVALRKEDANEVSDSQGSTETSESDQPAADSGGYARQISISVE